MFMESNSDQFEFTSQLELHMNVCCFPDGGSDDGNSSAWVSMYVLDPGQVFERIMQVVGRKPTDIHVRVMYLDKTLSFSGKIMNMDFLRNH